MRKSRIPERKLSVLRNDFPSFAPSSELDWMGSRPQTSGKWRGLLPRALERKGATQPSRELTFSRWAAKSGSLRLVADDGDLCFWNFQPHQAVIAVEQEKNLEVGGGDFESFIGLSIGASRAGGLHGDRAPRQFLRNKYREKLPAAL